MLSTLSYSTRRGILAAVCVMFLSAAIAQNVSEKGKKAFDKKDYKGAIKQFSKLIEINNASYLDYYYRGLSYYRTNQYKEAYMDLSECVKIQPDFAEAYYARGTMLMSPQLMHEALNDFNMAVKYAKNDSIKAHALAQRASGKLSNRNIESAIKDCRESLKIDSVSKYSEYTYGTLSNCLGMQKKYDESIAILRMLYKRDSTALETTSNLGFELCQVGKYDEAIYYFDKVLRKDPNAAYTLSNKSYALMKLGNINEAMTLITKSINLDPSNSFAFKHLGQIYLQKGDKSTACEAFQLALKKGFTETYGEDVNDLVKANCK